jgi:hypothetical protein
MNDDSGTHEYKLGEAGSPSEPGDGFSKDEIDSLADLIGDGTDPNANIDLEDTGRFTR